MLVERHDLSRGGAAYVNGYFRDDYDLVECEEAATLLCLPVTTATAIEDVNLPRGCQLHTNDNSLYVNRAAASPSWQNKGQPHIRPVCRVKQYYLRTRGSPQFDRTDVITTPEECFRATRTMDLWDRWCCDPRDAHQVGPAWNTQYSPSVGCFFTQSNCNRLVFGEPASSPRTTAEVDPAQFPQCAAAAAVPDMARCAPALTLPSGAPSGRLHRPCRWRRRPRFRRMCQWARRKRRHRRHRLPPLHPRRRLPPPSGTCLERLRPWARAPLWTFLAPRTRTTLARKPLPVPSAFYGAAPVWQQPPT